MRSLSLIGRATEGRPPRAGAGAALAMQGVRGIHMPVPRLEVWVSTEATR